MSLGILNNVSAIYAQNNLNNTQSSLQKVLQQLSSGARINSGADDAAGLAIANGLKANEAALTQSTQNASDGIGLLQTADGALSQVTNLLNRAVTLATEAANGTLSSSQVSSANQEYQSIISEIGSIGGTTNFNGNNVFSNTSTNFYVGDGTSSGSNIYNDVTGALSITSVGQSAPAAGAVAVAAATVPAYAGGHAAVVAASGTTGSSSVVGTATLTFNGTTDIVGGALTFTQSGTTGQTFTSTILPGSNLTVAAAKIQADSAGAVTAAVVSNTIVLTSTQAASAAYTSVALSATSITDATPVGGTATFSLANATDTIGGAISFTQGTTTATTNIAAGSTLAQAVAALNATGGVFANASIVASAVGTTLVLTNTGSTTAQVAQQISTATTAGSSLTDTQVTSKLAVPTPTASGNNTSSVATFGTLQNSKDTIVGTLNVSVGAGNAISVSLAPGTTLSGAVALLNNNAQLKAAGILASTSGTSLVLTGPKGTGANSSDLTLTGTVLSDAPASSGPGAGTDFTSSTLSALTTANAQNILTGVNSAIANVSYQRGILGAYSNQLTAASNTAASENVNLTAAESSIRSTNYGQATSDLAKYEVLSQTGISALAQANTVQQEILKLLQ